jgi:hypothetical protein
LKWRRKDAYYWERDCGRYTVDVAPIPGSRTGYRYSAWRRSTEPKQMAENLGCFDELREAFAACVDDLKRQAK